MYVGIVVVTDTYDCIIITSDHPADRIERDQAGWRNTADAFDRAVSDRRSGVSGESGVSGWVPGGLVGATGLCAGGWGACACARIYPPYPPASGGE